MKRHAPRHKKLHRSNYIMAQNQKMDVDLENDSKRKRSDGSSVSELETSITTTQSEKQKQKSKPKKSKKSKTNDDEDTDIDKDIDINKKTDSTENKNTIKIETTTKDETSEQLKLINQKLSNVLTKDDVNLKKMIKEIVKEMKDELIASVSHKIDVLESRLFAKEEETDKLNTKIETLNKTIDEQNEKYNKLKSSAETSTNKVVKKINELEQYGRRNNIRINGIPEVGTEDADTTTHTVIETLNNKIENLNLTPQQIDISHRLGPQLPGKKRQIIVKFVSRMIREKVITNRRKFKGTDIFICEDLTKMNNDVLSSLRLKQKDEIKQAWSKNGNLYYKNEHDHVHDLKFKDYQKWLDMDWPKDGQ